MKKEYVTWKVCVDVIPMFNYPIYDYYYGYIKENTKRGTSIVEVEFVAETINLIKQVKCGLFNLLNKREIVCNTIYFSNKETKTKEVESKVLRRYERNKVLDEGKECLGRFLKRLDEGCVPEKRWVREWCLPYINEEKKKKMQELRKLMKN